MTHITCKTSPREIPTLEVANILNRYRELIHPLPREAKVVRDIINCRTERLGGHKMECADCGKQEHSYNSCRNRHCPKCQFLRKERWIEARVEELLPVEYFHVVFTVPHEFNQLTLQNKTALYNILFRAAAETLKCVARAKLDAEIGFIAILHTWGQNLIEHPHLHIIVPGGGLSDGNTWRACKKGYFLPLKSLSAVFRGKFLNYLENAHEELHFEGAICSLRRKELFKKLLVAASTKTWVVYVKKSFAGPKQVVNYLGQYTHRIAISNHRLIKIENDQIYFRYRDYADDNKNKVMALPAVEFINRFLSHVLPYKFMRIRHFGLLGNRQKKEKLSRIRQLLGEKTVPEKGAEHVEIKTWEERLKDLTGIDLSRCSNCGGQMRINLTQGSSSYATASRQHVDTS